MKYRVSEMAKRLKVTRSWVYWLISKGFLKADRTGKYFTVTASSLNNMQNKIMQKKLDKFNKEFPFLGLPANVNYLPLRRRTLYPTELWKQFILFLRATLLYQRLCCQLNLNSLLYIIFSHLHDSRKSLRRQFSLNFNI